MKSGKLISGAGTLIMALLLVACKPSAEKLSEAEALKAELIEAKNNAENTYLDITDSSLKGTLDELAQKESVIENKDFSKMSNSMLEYYGPKMTELTTEYRGIQATLDAKLAEDNAKREAAQREAMINATIINNTDFMITEMMLHDLTSDAYSANLLDEGVTLAAGYTLVGVDLDIRIDSTQWEIVIKDDGGNSFTFVCGDFNQASRDGIFITLSYDKSAGGGVADIQNQ
ncbi:hypothetical protein [Butyrivibrio sp. M55]|jgi:hypothetical protein|uniref:hypothetical protein n=1 Tax=Butyrivibrio sp. M55 TaxID=1855323 RepID=UPI0008E0B203|nr:hypothetical protein [Butyrivibrio sp. M55]SFU54903.1 hypothetical protein SAMN05216540_103286 [Butyrivibrio sp. M55]